MNERVLLGAFLLGLIAGCSFQNKFADYCRNSNNCDCSVGVCCVKEGRECSDELGCCSGLTCNPNSRRCDRSATGGGGGSGGGAGGGGEPVYLTVIDAGGTWREQALRLIYPDGGLVSIDRFCADGGEHPTWIHADGGVTRDDECCSPNFAGLCRGPTRTCTLPGQRSSPDAGCCFCDESCAEDQDSMICPLEQSSHIDVLVAPVSFSSLPPEFRCADGGLKSLEGCCAPNAGFDSCSFDSVSCTLEAQSGSPCCLVAWDYFTPPALLNDCRVNGACECNASGGCANAAGAICVDLVP